MSISIALASLGAGLARSTAGWLEQSSRDGKITRFEVKKLVETTIRVGILHAAIALGAQGAGLDVNVLATATSAFLADKLFHALKAW